MVPGETSCPGVPQGGRGCLRTSYRRPKLTLVSKKIPNIAVSKKKALPNFPNRACPLKSLLPKDYGKK